MAVSESQVRGAACDCGLFLKGNESGGVLILGRKERLWCCGTLGKGSRNLDRVTGSDREKVNLRAVLEKETVQLGNVKYKGKYKHPLTIRVFSIENRY